MFRWDFKVGRVVRLHVVHRLKVTAKNTQASGPLLTWILQALPSHKVFPLKSLLWDRGTQERSADHALTWHEGEEGMG